MLQDLQLIAIGIGIGFMLSAPVGPVNILCIQRTLERGFWGGLASGLGAVLCDGLIALFAAAGITVVSSAILTYNPQIKVFGGIVMIAFGIFTLSRPKTINAAPDASGGMAWSILQTFLLSITNPGAVLGLFAVFGSVGTAYGIGSFAEALRLVFGIVLGGLLWWTILATMVSLLRDRISAQRLSKISRTASFALMLFGLGLLIDVVWRAVG